MPGRHTIITRWTRALDERRSGVLYAAVLAIVLLVYADRHRAVWYGYPFEGHPDEAYVVEAAYRIARTGDLNPRFFNYPSFNIYALAAVFEATDLWSRIVSEDEPFLAADRATPDHYVAGRFLVLVFSALTLIATAEAGRRLVSPLAGIAAACFLGAAPLPTKFSFVVSVNAATALWGMLFFLAAIRILWGGLLRHYVLAGLFAGFAIGSKYIAFLLVAPVLLAHFLPLLGGRAAASRRISNLVWFLALVPAGFLLTTPYSVLDTPSFIEGVRETRGFYESSNYPLNTSATATSFAEYAAGMWKGGYGAAPLLLALAGLAWLATTRWRDALVLAAYPLLLWLFLGSHKVFFVRNLLSAVPFLALMSGAAIHGAWALFDSLGRRLPRRAAGRSLAATGTVLLLVLCLWPTARLSGILIRDRTMIDVRQSALDWVLEHVPPGSRVIRELRTPPLEEWTDDYEVRFVRSIVSPDRRDELPGAYDYALVTIAFTGAVRHSPELSGMKAAYEEFFEQHELAAEFRGSDRELAGGTIRIYRIRAPGEPR